MRVDKKTKRLHGLASVLISLAMASAFAFPLAAFADEPEAPDAGTAAAEAAADTAAGGDAGSGALAGEAGTGTEAEPADAAEPAAPAIEEGTLERAAPGEAPGPGYSAYGGAWAPYTGSLADDITTFAITSGTGAGTTGHITVGSPGQVPLRSDIGEASYYVTSPDGRVLTYAFDSNDFDTSFFGGHFHTLHSGGSSLTDFDFDTCGIDEVYTQEASPGYTAVQFRSYDWRVSVSAYVPALYFDISLTLTPQPDGTVLHDLELISHMGNADTNFAATVGLDIQLGGDDSPSVYSLGTDQGMYAALADGSATATFPWLAADGAADMAAVQYGTSTYVVFGSPVIGSTNISRGVPSIPGDVLLSGTDSAVYMLFGYQTISANDSRTMSYAVNLALGPDAALPATGDSSPLALAGGLGILAAGTALAAASRRYRRKDTD